MLLGSGDQCMCNHRGNQGVGGQPPPRFRLQPRRQSQADTDAGAHSWPPPGIPAESLYTQQFIVPRPVRLFRVILIFLMLDELLYVTVIVSRAVEAYYVLLLSCWPCSDISFFIPSHLFPFFFFYYAHPLSPLLSE